MSERERTNFLKAAVSRAPGKRQIKPSAAIFEGEAGIIDDDEDDEDFQVTANGEESSTDKGSSDDQSSSGSLDSEDNENGSENDEEEDEEVIVLDNEGNAVAHEAGTSAQKPQASEPLICSICLNARRVTKGAEVIQCDKCGLAVHEACYAVEEPLDDASVTSSSSTEPWFCEPCMFGLNVVPNCELCPNRLGAFKKANVNGSWVHLLCALYTPGMSFGDTDHLTAISWQEMDFRSFGRKPCALCTNKLEARTGVTVQCEAGLCKNYYHVTCAQKLGFLMDTDSDEHCNGLSTFNFLLCKHHNHSDALRTKKEAYVKFTKQETRRMAMFNRQLIGSRQEQKRRNQLQSYLTRMHRFETFVTVAPGLNKKGRMLHNNSRFLSSFMEKAELVGIENDQYENSFLLPAAEQLPAITPTLSVHFAKYFDHRENQVFKDEEERLAQTKTEKLAAQTKLKNLEHSVSEARLKLSEVKKQNELSLSLLQRFCDTLYSLDVPKKHCGPSLASVFIFTPAPKVSLSPKCSPQKSPKQKIEDANVPKQSKPPKTNVKGRGRKRAIDPDAEDTTKKIENFRCRQSDLDLLQNSLPNSLNSSSLFSSETTAQLNSSAELNSAGSGHPKKANKSTANSPSKTQNSGIIKKKRKNISNSSPAEPTLIEPKVEPEPSASSNSVLTATSIIASANSTPTKVSALKRPNILSRSSSKVVTVTQAKLSVELQKPVSSITPLQIEIPNANSASKPSLASLSGKSSKDKFEKNHVGIDSASAASSANAKTLVNAGSKPVEPNFASNNTEILKSQSIADPSDDCEITSALLLLLKSHRDDLANNAPLSNAPFFSCFTCSETNDCDMMVYCDTCKHYFHISCLDPPLSKLPAKRKNFAFQCSDCACPSSSSASDDESAEAKLEENKSIVADTTPLATRRQRRSTTALSHSFESLSPNFIPSLPKQRRRKKKFKNSLNSSNTSKFLNGRLSDTSKDTCTKKTNLKSTKDKISIWRTSPAKSHTLPFASTMLPPISVKIESESARKANETNKSVGATKRSRKQSITLTPSPNFPTATVTGIFASPTNPSKLDNLERSKLLKFSNESNLTSHSVVGKPFNYGANSLFNRFESNGASSAYEPRHFSSTQVRHNSQTSEFCITTSSTTTLL